MNYQENDEEEENIDKNKKNAELNEKRTSIIINNINYKVRIKLNDVLYLARYDINKIYKFKKILIENITTTFVYVRIGFNSITDQISHAEWDYPNINNYFLQLLKISQKIIGFIFISIPSLELNLQNDLIYWSISTTSYKLFFKITNNKENDFDKPLFIDIFSIYGKMEHIYIIIKLIIHAIYSCIFFKILIKRMLAGGFKNMAEIKKENIKQKILLVVDSIFILSDFIIILFCVFSVICYYKNFYSSPNNNIMIIIYFQTTTIIATLINDFKIFIEIIKYGKYIEKLRNAMICFDQRADYFDEEDINFRPVEFKFISLEGDICSIKECVHPYLQRYLYYYEDKKDNKTNNISNEVNNEIINIKANNANNNITSNNMDENKNILDDNSNNIEIEMQKATSGDSNN